MQIELVEVESFSPPEEGAPRDPAEIGPDPVERDRQEIHGQYDVLNKIANKMLAGPVAPPQSELKFGRTYDVPAPSLEAAAAMLHKFEEAAETIGTPAPYFEPPPRGFYMPNVFGGR
jgi:hypothetical protein